MPPFLAAYANLDGARFFSNKGSVRSLFPPNRIAERRFAARVLPLR